MNTHQFYRKYEALPDGDRFVVSTAPNQPTSLFVIFKKLSQVRAQIRYFEEEEALLLRASEHVFKQLEK